MLVPVLGCKKRSPAPGGLPNIVVIYPDQLRSMALSVYGQSNIDTPNIDSLLSSGTHFPVTTTPNPVCTPARAGTLFGRMPSSSGVFRNGDRPISSLQSIANVLNDAGYACGYIGKWHLDGHSMPGFVGTDERFGFDTWYAYNFHHNYMAGGYFEGDNTEYTRSDTYLPYRETELCLDFISQNRDQPFFAFLSYGPPHPAHAAPTSYRGDIPEEWLSALEIDQISFSPNVPEWIQPYNRGANNSGSTQVGAREYLWGYYAATLSIDECVRRRVCDHALLQGTRMGQGRGTAHVGGTGRPIRARSEGSIPTPVVGYGESGV